MAFNLLYISGVNKKALSSYVQSQGTRARRMEKGIPLVKRLQAI
jgi:hypothetical protein